ncbi:MAG: PHP-associated domain-containing protein [Promethearchaeota archaeon]
MKRSIIDLHVHTRPYSSCSRLSLREVLNNLDPTIEGLGITNHDSLDGVPRYARKGKTKDGESVLLPGVEITTIQGHIIAFGITEPPSKHLTPKEVIKIIHDEGGVAIAAHPFKLGFKFEEMENLEWDAIEINGKIGRRENKQARQLARLLEIPLVGGSDTHSLKDLNSCVTVFKQEIKTVADVVHQIQRGLCSASWLGFTKR